jgi:hypothetical protein
MSNTWNTDIHLMVAIFQGAYQAGTVIKDPEEYLKVNNTKIKDAGPELEFLGLAKRSKKSPLGWRPTLVLMKIIAARLTTNTAPPLYQADIFFRLSRDVRSSHEEKDGSVLADELLVAVGLLVRDDSRDYWVTSRLHELFVDGYYNKCGPDQLYI